MMIIARLSLVETLSWGVSTNSTATPFSTSSSPMARRPACHGQAKKPRSGPSGWDFFFAWSNIAGGVR